MRCSIPCCPLLFLARIVLGSALFFAGWHLVFGDATLTAEDQRLLDDTPAATDGIPAVAVVTLALQTPSPASADASTTSSTDEPTGTPTNLGPTPTDSVTEGEPVGQEKAVRALALELQKAGFAGPGASIGVAWTLSLLQLIGGAMLVVGLLTRVWAAVAVLVLALLFWFQSAGMLGTNPLNWASNPSDFMLLYAQLGGVVLGLSLLRSGGGVLSLDQFIFGRPTDIAADTEEAE